MQLPVRVSFSMPATWQLLSRQKQSVTGRVLTKDFPFYSILDKRSPRDSGSLLYLDTRTASYKRETTTGEDPSNSNGEFTLSDY